MSFVSTVVIQVGDYTRKEEALKKLNGWLKENNHLGVEFSYADCEKSAGTKYAQVNLLWGGFNYLGTTEFIEFFKSLDLNNSLLTIANEDGDLYRVITSGADLETE